MHVTPNLTRIAGKSTRTSKTTNYVKVVLREQMDFTVGETKQLLPFLFDPFRFDAQIS